MIKIAIAAAAFEAIAAKVPLGSVGYEPQVTGQTADLARSAHGRQRRGGSPTSAEISVKYVPAMLQP
jgi:hypothetical protein